MNMAVSATCGTHVGAGAVQMASNYDLEPWEVEKGYVLTGQSNPVSESVALDYEKSYSLLRRLRAKAIWVAPAQKKGPIGPLLFSCA